MNSCDSQQYYFFKNNIFFEKENGMHWLYKDTGVYCLPSKDIWYYRRFGNYDIMSCLQDSYSS